MRSLCVFISVLAAMPCVTLMPVNLGAATLRMVIQTHPDLGVRCLDVPRAQYSTGMRLQIWGCWNAPQQVFVYDDQTQELKIGGLCITSWGRGDPQDAVGIDTCNGSANQHWRMVVSKDYYQIVGVNNLCLDVRYGTWMKQNGTPLDIYTCATPTAVQRLWTLVEAPK